MFSVVGKWSALRGSSILFLGCFCLAIYVGLHFTVLQDDQEVDGDSSQRAYAVFCLFPLVRKLHVSTLHLIVIVYSFPGRGNIFHLPLDSRRPTVYPNANDQATRSEERVLDKLVAIAASEIGDLAFALQLGDDSQRGQQLLLRQRNSEEKRQQRQRLAANEDDQENFTRDAEFAFETGSTSGPPNAFSAADHGLSNPEVGNETGFAPSAKQIFFTTQINLFWAAQKKESFVKNIRRLLLHQLIFVRVLGPFLSIEGSGDKNLFFDPGRKSQLGALLSELIEIQSENYPETQFKVSDQSVVRFRFGAKIRSIR